MTEDQRLCAAVDDFAEAMKKRLIKKMDDGYRGWDDPICQDGILQDAIGDVEKIKQGDHVAKHCIDVANRLMMIWTVIS